MDGIGYHGDHDFMASFVRFDITVRVGDKFIHEETEYTALECYEYYGGDDKASHRWFVEPEKIDSSDCEESIPDSNFYASLPPYIPKPTKIIVTVDKSSGKIILAENLPKGYELIIKML